MTQASVASTGNDTVHLPWATIQAIHKVIIYGSIRRLSRPYHPVATSNILKKMTDPNLPTMRTRINGLALTLAEKTWAQDKLTANPDLATTWTPETDIDLTAFIKQSATQSAHLGLYGALRASQALACITAALGSVLAVSCDRRFCRKFVFWILLTLWWKV
ncbi:hypothetical protein PROFUN_13557 [Planoprotostelium fungivorum]|uniref:Uncharacterized protein n=1 Tax=Planoprotostelium fungivorum TaxID=1890364 RepID=A0A2P6N3T1_9EUKA|nr:hypothetical protein PROFUN_13557 [Planoprotostelium fungivorum]